MQTLTTLSHADAQRAIAAIQAELARLNKPAVITVADSHGELIALLRLDGAPFPCITIATNKAFSAARERKPTREIGRAVKHPDTGFHPQYFGDSRFVGWGGGLPVIINNTVVGAIAVSGLPEDEDARIAQIGIEAILASAAQ